MMFVIDSSFFGLISSNTTVGSGLGYYHCFNVSSHSNFFSHSSAIVSLDSKRYCVILDDGLSFFVVYFVVASLHCFNLHHFSHC